MRVTHLARNHTRIGVRTASYETVYLHSYENISATVFKFWRISVSTDNDASRASASPKSGQGGTLNQNGNRTTRQRCLRHGQEQQTSLATVRVLSNRKGA
eukprot:gb/GECG01013489.1/.p1 GENE.gb/GECG01013489.1/~~gb/GECG01013489.1/.p1  ORF type:complete len:100 (+),score=5.24 gb/GECG01013489.1/:1-300(+)